MAEEDAATPGRADAAGRTREPPRTSARATARSSTIGKAYASRGEDRRSYLARLPEGTYDALMTASDATGTSANALAVEALDAYLSSPQLHARLVQARRTANNRVAAAETAQARQQAAIDRLSGA